MSFSENAILTKSRAIYARRLSTQNYRELLSLSNVEDAALYLGSKTNYAETFRSLTSAKMNRVMIENALKKNMTDQFLSLSHFARILGSELYKYLVIRNDIDVILSCIRFMETPNKYDYQVNIPVSSDRISSVDLATLASSKSFKEIVESLKGTDYYKILSKFVDDSSNNVLMIENALNGYLYRKINSIASEKLKGKEKKEFTELLAMAADIKTLEAIYRLRCYFKFTPEQIDIYNPNYGITALTERQIDEFKMINNTEEFFSVLKKTVYGSKVDTENFISIENCLQKSQYKIMSHKATYSTYPNVVMLCCIFLAENEVRNITHIVEGIKYGLPKDEIVKRLIGCENLKEGDK